MVLTNGDCKRQWGNSAKLSPSKKNQFNGCDTPPTLMKIMGILAVTWTFLGFDEPNLMAQKKQETATIEDRRRAVGAAMRERVADLKRSGKIRTLANIARDIGVHETTLYGYLRGENFSDNFAFSAFCRTIGFSPEKALDGRVEIVNADDDASHRVAQLIEQLRGQPEEAEAISMLEYLAAKRAKRLGANR